ncbi:hypothetical protein PYJP_01470 [Pyrofollis japonicus]|uniref:zinc ribbon domain-containing protein n=1 Tax=Pyrofollis japonicus TaxID=3060460 RepID=UPI00295AC4A6|nr:zinc ribbon domain-containing protein [Pyrofollis japonicus]BEP16795.1 hypothetical protein PYJP_01470 [Pyrofollis japonicus]
MGVETVLESAENKLAAIMTLASSVDGVDIVVGVHEGLIYRVESPKPEMQAYATELARLADVYLKAASTSVAGKASVVLTNHREKSILAADVGEGYSVLVLGEHAAIEGLLEPVVRIVEGRPLRCPKCGALLEVFTMTCPNCGRRVAFGARSCPFCGADLSVKKCPNCGTMLRLVERRLEPVGEARAEEREEAAAIVETSVARGQRIGAWSVVLATIGAAAYFALVGLLGLPLGKSIIAGIVPIAASYVISAMKG